MKPPKFKVLSHSQRVAWYAASLVFGLGIIAIAVNADAFADPQVMPAAIIIFATCWFLGVLLLRLFLQQIENPADLSSFFAPGRKRKK